MVLLKVSPATKDWQLATLIPKEKLAINSHQSVGGNLDGPKLAAELAVHLEQNLQGDGHQLWIKRLRQDRARLDRHNL